MRHYKFFCIIVLAAILSLLFATIPATPVWAASITLSPTEGKIGTSVTITGSGFTASTEGNTELVVIYFSDESATVGKYIGDDVLNYEYLTYTSVSTSGSFSTSPDIPEALTDGDVDVDVESGTYYFYITEYGDYLITARATFTVIVPGISLSPAKGVVGTSVKITGTDFGAREDIIVNYDGGEIAIASGNEKTSSTGGFTCNVAIPESTAGKHTITVEIGTEETEVEFTVEPKITISPTSGIIGDSVKVTGTGFDKSKSVTITFDGSEVGTGGTTNTYGSFEANFKVPAVESGTFKIIAKDSSNNTAQGEFTMTTNISLNPVTSEASPGYVGMGITINGTGFQPNSKVTITYTSEPIVVATPTSDAEGAFSATFKVPLSKAGQHTITATDGTNTMQAAFVMESASPATPTLLLPAADSQAESIAAFDWDGVTKDVNGADEKSTPVTYDLQIATDRDFNNIILNKTSLTTSEYTLIKEEKLQSTKKDAPYYWQVRAVDAASNTGAWTSPRTFFVGSSFEIKGWLLYVLIGIGFLLFLFIGIRIGRITGRNG